MSTLFLCSAPPVAVIMCKGCFYLMQFAWLPVRGEPSAPSGASSPATDAAATRPTPVWVGDTDRPPASAVRECGLEAIPGARPTFFIHNGSAEWAIPA